ncbi:MAG TPA: type 2 isopentenyl-diphosphate Delta-isomerase [Desulfotomaculum sp.]|nr:type 2 isopentenyl-diphosphate Delta-isomerase [Desulfotomaculum sp.]
MKRQERKLDHLKYSLEMPESTCDSGFSDVRLIHQSVSGVRLSDTDTSTIFLGKRLEAPLMINAITGGHPQTLRINRELAIAARKTGVAMAVGSQKAALEDSTVEETYRVAREENPDGVLLANLSATCTLEEAAAAVSMIGADGLQVHFNVPQELVMDEGEPDFGMALPCLKRLVENVECPVIAKEVGFGMSGETMLRLYNTGIRIMDIGGRGGTNFISIENARKEFKNNELEGWGIPTAICLFEGLELGLNMDIVASGGLRTSLDITCALAAGAKVAAMAGPFLDIVSRGSVEALVEYIEGLKKGLSMYMVLTGARNISELGAVPLVITGKTAEWLLRRGVNIDGYARRNRKELSF